MLEYLREKLLKKVQEEVNKLGVGGLKGKISDGYHTFNELYEFRKVYNAALFNEWYTQNKYNVHKAIRHNDGELCFGGGWFIVVANLPSGQISNHYEMKDWELFKCRDVEKALSPSVIPSLRRMIDKEKEHLKFLKSQKESEMVYSFILKSNSALSSLESKLDSYVKYVNSPS